MEKFEIRKDNIAYRLGIFNDCFLSSFNDFYTYTNRSREIKWLSTINNHLPFGGEVCKDYNLSNLENCLPEMNNLSLSYLNKQFNQSVIINKWQNIKYNSSFGKDDLYYNVTPYDYISTHMGYIFVIRSINVNYRKGGKYELTINIDNVGFGNLLKSKRVNIIYTDMNEITIISRNNVGLYRGENIIKINGELLEKDHQDYKVFVSVYSSIENNTVYYPIQFVNVNIYNNKIKANLLSSVKDGGEIIK